MTSREDRSWAAFVRLQACLWSCTEISSQTKSRVYHWTVRFVLLCGSEKWTLRVVDDNECHRSIQQHRRAGRVSYAATSNE